MTNQLPEWALPLLLPLVVWDLAWRGLAMWRAGRANQPKWFMALLIVNSLGLLPIIYLLLSRKNSGNPESFGKIAIVKPVV